MTEAKFLDFETHPGVIISVAQIASVEQTQVVVSEKKRKHFVAKGATAAIVHLLTIFLAGRKNIELAFDSEATCTGMFKLIKMAIKPLTIPRPGISPRQPAPTATRKTYTRDEIFATREEFERAVAEALAERKGEPPTPPPAPPVPPAAKPPRKPRK